MPQPEKMLPISEETSVIVRDSVWTLRLRALTTLGGSFLIAYFAPRGVDQFFRLLLTVIGVGSVMQLFRSFNPQTRLLLDATGIRAVGYDALAWQQLASFYYTEETDTDESKAHLVFTTCASQQVTINLDAADANIQTIRQAIKRFNTNPLLLDHGQR